MTAANFHWATFSSWRSRRRGPLRQAPSRSSLGPDETTMTKVLQPGSADKKSSKNHQKRSEDDSKITFKKNNKKTIEQLSKKKKTVRKRSDNDQKTTRKCLNYDQDLQGKTIRKRSLSFRQAPFFMFFPTTHERPGRPPTKERASISGATVAAAERLLLLERQRRPKMSDVAQSAFRVLCPRVRDSFKRNL